MKESWYTGITIVSCSGGGLHSLALSSDAQVFAWGCNSKVDYVCDVLKCAAVCCSVLQYVAVCCSVLQCVAVCCSVLHSLALSSGAQVFAWGYSSNADYVCDVLQCVAVCCSVLQCVTACCSVLQCVAVST